MAVVTVMTLPRALTSARRVRRIGLVGAITILAASNVVSNRVVGEDGYVAWNLAIAVLLVLLARGSGLSWADLGLDNVRLRRGLRIGGVIALSVLGLYLLALTLPSTRAMFEDTRAAGTLGMAMWAALIRIPMGTVILEELAFRGVLPALVSPDRFWPGALVSSVLFGLWHVLPSIGLSAANAGLGATLGDLGEIVQVSLAVLAMTGAGLLLMAYRRWGGHLVTPMAAHVATNSLGILIAWWVITT
jgi:membrane protease YdiL (CAAX protease family)